MKPPRALWVPFELGRPLGVPDNAAFQARVLLAALKLLEASSGPVIEDFTEDVPVSGDISTVWACPVDFSREEADLSNSELLGRAFKKEVMQLSSWYELAVKKRGRTTVGVSGLELGAICDFICSFLNGDIPENPRPDLPLGFTLKLALDDLKALYTEAVTAQPGQISPESNDLLDWFWGETIAAKVLRAIKEICTKSDDPVSQLVGKMLLVPVAKAQSSE